MGDHDHSYRLLFEHSDMVADLLKGFVHESWVQDLDFSTLERLPGAHVDDKLKKREIDMVWRLHYRGEDWLYIYLLLEFQSTVDPYMALRLLGYVSQLCQHLKRQDLLTRDGKIPPVLPLVLYNGDGQWKAVRDVADLFAEAPPGLERYRPRMPYLLVDEQRLELAELESLQNLAAALFRLEKNRLPPDILRVVEALRGWLEDRDDLRRAFEAWIRKVLLARRWPKAVESNTSITLEELEIMLRERDRPWPEVWAEKGEKKGLQKGRREGRKTGRVELLKRQLEAKFGPLDDSVHLRLHEASSRQLLTWGTRLITADRLDDVFS